MDALLAGATGLIGREIARAWSARSAGTLWQLVRRAGAAEAGPRLHEQVVDYARLGPLAPAEIAFCALGTTIKTAGSQAAFRAVDFDAVLAFAQASHAAGVRRLGVVSALGADPASRSFYSRVKGEAEQALAGIGFERLVIARPSLLAGDRAALGQPARPAEALALRLALPVARWIPKAWRPIDAGCVAQALMRSVVDDVLPKQAGPRVSILESAQLQELGRGDRAG